MAAAAAHGIARPAVARSPGVAAWAWLEHLAALLRIQFAIVLEIVGKLHPSRRRSRLQWLALAGTFQLGTPFLSVDSNPLVRLLAHRRPPPSRFSVLLGGARQ